MTRNELAQIHARYFNLHKSPPIYIANDPTPVYTGSEKTNQRRRERRHWEMLWDGKKFINGQWIGQTFVGSIRDTFGLTKGRKLVKG